MAFKFSPYDIAGPKKQTNTRCLNEQRNCSKGVAVVHPALGGDKYSHELSYLTVK